MVLQLVCFSDVTTIVLDCNLTGLCTIIAMLSLILTCSDELLWWLAVVVVRVNPVASVSAGQLEQK